MKISNINGKPNQFIIENGKETFFQSYNSMIAKVIDNGFNPDTVYLDEKFWNYSKTTSKYRNIFLNMNTKEIEKHIKNGFITLTNLNKD